MLSTINTDPLKVGASTDNASAVQTEQVNVREIGERQEAEKHLHQLNRLYAALIQVNQTIIHATSANALCEKICRILVEQGQFKMAWVGWLDPVSQMIRPKAIFGDETGYTKSLNISTDDRPEGQGPGGTAFREGRMYVCNDFLADPNMLPWRESARLAGFNSLISLPVKHDGKAVGVLTVYAGECNFFGDKEVALLQETAADISFALDNFERDARENQAQTALQDREELHSAIFAQAVDSIALVEVETGRFVEFNEAAHKNLGYEREAFARLGVSDIEARQSPEEIRKTFVQMQQRNGVVLETGLRHRDGGLREVRVGARGVTLKGKNYLVAVWADITESKRTEESLRKSEELYRSLFKNMLNGFAYCRMLFTAGKPQDFIYLAVNDAFESQTGLKNVVGKKVTEIIPGIRETDPQLFEQYGRVAMGGQPEQFELFLEALQMWFSISVFSPGHEHFVAVFDVITERKRAEAEAKLQISALNSAANAIAITNSAGVIVFVNDAFTTLTGYTREEAVGQNPKVFKSAKHSPEFYKNLWDTIIAGNVWQGELWNRRKDGSLYEEEMIITPMKDGAGKITHFIAIKQDVTQKKVTERHLYQAQRLESIGLLAGGIAHDLNNVLAPVLMSTELLRSMELPADALPILETVETSARRGADIVQQVLTFARGKPEHKGPVQFRHLIKDIVKLAKETFPRNIGVSSHLPGGLWPVNGDGTQLHQILLNLSLNARDAMPAGGILTFHCCNEHLDEIIVKDCPHLKPGDYLKLEVSDTGTGIPPELVDKIFEPFFTTKELGKGTGLGLSTVMGIVRGHGGCITVESTLGQGTKFTVLLPALPATDIGEGDDNRPALPKGHEELILIVDDEPGILTVTQAFLQRQGFRTTTASNGAEAITAFIRQQTEIALVITDIMMPVMDGVALVSELRRIKPEIKCIACSGLLEEKDAVRLEQLKLQGVKHFLTKPFAAGLLLDTVGKILGGEV